jgi:hypothetical protein
MNTTKSPANNNTLAEANDIAVFVTMLLDVCFLAPS